MGVPSFKKSIIGEIINKNETWAINTLSTTGDINNDGMLDFVISGRNGRMVWLENKGPDKQWEEHLIDEVQNMECGGLTIDITGNGFPDIVNGSDAVADEVYWWENPGKTGAVWKKRLIAKTGHKQFHDMVAGDVANDGRISLVFTNQKGESGTDIYRIPIPKDPFISPWPDIELIASGMAEPRMDRGTQPEEGLAIGDIDGDGKNELVCGTHWYKYSSGKWEFHRFSAGYVSTKVAVGDIDGDGKNEIILSEGDPLIYGKPQGGKLSWFKPGNNITELWNEHVIEDFLLDAHSLQLGNICGNGKLDIFIGEIGKGDATRDNYIIRAPRLIIFENDGHAHFTRHVVDEGTGTHEAVLADLRNSGLLDIIGKPLNGPERWNAHVWYNTGMKD